MQDDVKAERVGNGMVEKVRFVGVGMFPMGIDVMRLQFQKCASFSFLLCEDWKLIDECRSELEAAFRF